MNSTDSFLSKLAGFLKHEDLHVNAFVLKKQGEITYEDYRPPYKKGDIYLEYSLSKMLTAIITGIAIDKGYFSVTDRVISFFPDKTPAHVSDNLAEMNVHHLLSMTTGRTEPDYYEIYPHTDWVKAFLALDVPETSGSVYLYSSHVSHVLSAIIHRTTGSIMSEFAAHHLFEPMGIADFEFETWKDGETVGGMGISLSTTDLSKIGEMLLDHGQYQGRQILSEDFIEKMTVNYSGDEKYGYAVHIVDDGSFYHPGGCGQLLYIIPKRDTVIAINSAAQVHKRFIEFIQTNAADDGPSDYVCSGIGLKSLLPETQGTKTNDFSYTFSVDANPHAIEKIHLDHSRGRTTMKLSGTDGKETERSYSFEAPVYGRREFVKDTCILLQDFVSSAYWEDTDTLILQTIYTQTPYCEKYIFKLSENLTLTYTLNPSLGPLCPLTPVNFTATIRQK